MTRDDTEIVSAVHRALAGKVGQQRFAIWFGRGVRMEPCGTTLRIAAADTFRLEYLRRHFRADLMEAARVAGKLVDIDLQDVEFTVDPTLAVISGHVSTAESSTAGTQNSPTRSPHSPIYSPQPDPGAPAVQRRHFASLSDFIASESNRVALSAAQTAATKPGVYTPLTFIGPPGSGKTHLLEGIWRHAKAARTFRSVVYLSAEQFTNQFIDALRSTGAPNFRRKIRDVELLLIDDVQFFAGKSSTLVEFVHTIDALLRGGRQLVFAADRPLAELRALGPEVITRLSGGLVSTLHPADFAARLAILTQIAKRQDLSVPADVLNWMAGQLEGDARHLSGALNRLRAASEAHELPIDLRFAQESLVDLVQAARRPVRVPEIVDAVCDVMGIEPGELKAGGKSARVTHPRMLVMFLARKYTRAALSEISQSLGRKSHSTVVSAQHKVNEWLAAGKTISLGHTECKIEDALRRIESKLKLA